jgi:hypothetical protein
MKRQKPHWLQHKLIVVVCLVGILGWVGAPAVYAQGHGSVVEYSGFSTWNVDTDKEKTFFEAHPQDKFVTYQQKDKVLHVYKDPQTGVVYVGDEGALQEYMQKVKDQGLSAKAREDAAEAHDPEFWQLWEDEQGGG